MPPHAAHPNPGSHCSPTDNSSTPPNSQPQLLATLGSNHVDSTEREVKTRAGGERPSAQTPPRAGKASAAGPSTCTAARARSVLTCTTSMPRFLWRKSKKTQVTPAGSKYPSSTSTTASWRQGGGHTSRDNLALKGDTYEPPASPRSHLLAEREGWVPRGGCWRETEGSSLPRWRCSREDCPPGHDLRYYCPHVWMRKRRLKEAK